MFLDTVLTSHPSWLLGFTAPGALGTLEPRDGGGGGGGLSGAMVSQAWKVGSGEFFHAIYHINHICFVYLLILYG